MMDRLLLLVLGAVCLCLPVPCFAQDLPSHRSVIENLPDPRSAETILRERMEKAFTQGRERDLRKLFGNKELLKQLTKGKLSQQQLQFLDANSDKIQKLLGDPRFIALLQQSMAARKSDQPLTEEQIKALSKLADHNLDPSELPALPGNPAAAAGASPETPQEQPPEAETPEGSSGSDAEADSGEGGDSWFDRQWNRLTSSVVDRLSDPENAGAFESALRSLGGIKPGVDGVDEFNLGGLWKNVSADAASWVTSRWQWPGKLADSSGRLYRDVRISLPEIGGSIDSVLARIPSTPSAAPDTSSVSTIAGIVGLLALALAGWKIIERRTAGKKSGTVGFNLGPWPVKPNAIATRDDFIRAFEYLAALKLGAEGRTSNHRAVATRLSDLSPDGSHRAAARDLARLYERARYEPQPRELDEATLAAARQDLTLLSGGVAA
jgi:hypothetical protein